MLSTTLSATADYTSSAEAMNTGTSFYASIGDASDASYAYGIDALETVDAWAFLCEWSDLSALAIHGVTVTIRAAFDPSMTGTDRIAAAVDIGGSGHTAPVQAVVNNALVAPGEYIFNFPLNPIAGTAWTPAALSAARFGAYYDVVGFDSPGARKAPYIYRVTVTVTYTPIPPTVDVTRHVGSLRLADRRQPKLRAQSTGNLDRLRMPILGTFDVEHTTGPHAEDVGWEDEPWQRRPFLVDGYSLDFDALAVRNNLTDLRPNMMLLRYLAWSKKASGALGNGIVFFATPGAQLVFSRASTATFTNPAGDSESVGIDVPAYANGGLLIKPASGPFGRAADFCRVTNNTGARVLNAAFGAFQAEVLLDAVSGSAIQTVDFGYHDANNHHWTYWDGANGRWVAEVKVAGSTYRATKSASPSSVTWYQIARRWTGSNGELGLAPYTLSLFVDRVKGTDAVASGVITEAGTSSVYIGSRNSAGTDILNGQIRKIHSYQYVPTDVEMARTL